MPLDVIRLVAWRDLGARLRTKAYRVSTVVTVVLVVAAVVVPTLLGDDDGGRPSYEVGVVGASSPAVEDAVQAGVGRSGATASIVEVEDRAEARARLERDELDLVVVEGRSVLVAEESATDATWQAAVAEAVGQVVALEDAGLGPDQIADVLAAKPLDVRGLATSEEGTGVEVGAFVGSLLLYSFISLYGAWVLYGVAEEKSTRVAEVLLSAVRPSQLLAGKVLGIGAAALLQGTLVVAAAVVAAELTGSDLLDILPPAQLAGMLGWFLLGYALYSVVYAAAGSLVARQEDVQNVATPPALPLLAGYLVASGAAFGGAETTVVRVFSLIPATAPVVMPVRTVMTDVPLWEVGLSVVLTLLTIVVLVQVAGRVYSRAILRTGGRVRWREALRATG